MSGLFITSAPDSTVFLNMISDAIDLEIDSTQEYLQVPFGKTSRNPLTEYLVLVELEFRPCI